ncbi:type III-B CRISPR module RAMP protein Cmr6 [Aliarcobacter butzleri]|uniref:type III-B CRISPR module RAMP protein Cmr6 n=1 Tax=Aliarcobacter butzleri TaxID=28197 RepID=UPI00125FE84B|nr:type III-B CRISPR module RAMP protein Cmr6 [Aliarcobacter butzleri]
MSFFYLNKIDSSISKEALEKEFNKFGKLKFIGNMKEDNRNQGFLSTVADFKNLEDEESLLNFCKNKRILAIKRKEDVNKQNSSTPKYIEKKEFNQEKTNNSSDIHNPSFHFYKDTNYGKEIENFTFKNSCSYFEIPNTQTFKLTTIYPGLLVGSGYNHPKLKDNKDDFQLGFFFDHTTGLPIISGSSIKGMLRSVCEKNDFMQDVYKKQIPLEIFEDGKTIFYDAFIVSSQNENNKIFGSDYITNHYSNEENGMFKEPNPIKFLKILSGVTFKFQFKCDEKYLELFKQIILDFGLGAKTNVGYGKFQEIEAKS